MEEERLDRFIDIGRLDVFMQLHGGAEREREREMIDSNSTFR